MSGWQDLYESGTFSIDTDEPSELVTEFLDQLPPNSRVADLGCGAGRNAIFLASRGFTVDASDIVDLDWAHNLSDDLSERISFEVTPAAEVELLEDSYGAVLLMRLLQYLSPEDLELLIQRSANSLVLGGLVIASFATTGVSPIVADSVPVFNHPAEDVASRLEQEGLKRVAFRELNTVSRHIPFHSVIDVCQLAYKK